VPHREANYTCFTAVLKTYMKKNPNGKIKKLNLYLSQFLESEISYDYLQIDELLSKLLEKKRLNEYGMKVFECVEFAESVLEKQTRLLANNYVELSRKEIIEIYKSLY